MRIGTAILVCLLLASAAALSNAADEKHELATTLKLLGKAEPAAKGTLEALRKNEWANRERKDILGRGVDEILHFTGEGDKIELERTVRHYFSVNDKKPGGETFKDEKRSSGCSLTGPVLQCGNDQQTVALIPGERLVLNAVVPLPDGAWYYTSRTVFGIGPDAPVHEDEMRFEFADDPLRKEEGKGVLKVRSDNGNNNVIKEIPISFSVDARYRDGRRVNVVAADGQKAKWADLVFAPGGECALILDQPNRSPKIFDAPILPVRKKN